MAQSAHLPPDRVRTAREPINHFFSRPPRRLYGHGDCAGGPICADRGGQQHSAGITTGVPPSLIRSKETLQLSAAPPLSRRIDARPKRRTQ